MRKLIAAMNMTLDGVCDHTSMVADDEIHRHYTELLESGGEALYGRVTYQLMEYWRGVVKNPTGNKANDEFAQAMDRIPKVVFSRTLKTVDWDSARLAARDLEDEVRELKDQPGRDILVGSPSLIAQLTELGLIDEYQLGLQPAIVGSGLQLFKNITDRVDLRPLKTKSFGCGVIMLYYERVRK